MSNTLQTDAEEGEILDDDLEEISDNSMSILDETGKSLSSKDHLPYISLSSGSDWENHISKGPERRKKRRKSRELHHQPGHHGHHHCHYNHHKSRRKFKGKIFRKHHKRKSKNWIRCSSSTNSDNSDCDSHNFNIKEKLQYQLKAAIRLKDEDEDVSKNSLEERLRAMTKANEPLVENAVENKGVDDKIVKQQSSEEDDTELIKLRAEALKTAFLNKCEHRKKRKLKELLQEEQDTQKDIDKENNIEEPETFQAKRQNVDKPEVQDLSSIEEDPDILRATALASLSKNITKDVNKLKIIPLAKRESQIHTNIIKRHQPGKPMMRPIPPKINPIIIQLRDDSSSDNESIKSPVKKLDSPVKKPDSPVNNSVNKQLEINVDKFLKEERAKVEEQQEVKTPTLKQNELSNKKSVFLEKSAVKLLPKVMQIEYQELLQKLKNAQTKPRLRRLSMKDGDDIKKEVKENSPTKQVTAVNKIDKARHNQDAQFLKIVKQIRKPINGRLQIDKKYLALTPLIKKVNAVKIERKKCDQELKRLASELTKARVKLYEAEKSFSVYLHDILVKKKEIDKRQIKNNVPNNKEIQPKCLSAPVTNASSKIILKEEIPPTPTNTIPVPSTLSSESDTSSTAVKLSAQKPESSSVATNADEVLDAVIKFENVSGEIDNNEEEIGILKISEMEDVICNGKTTNVLNKDDDDKMLIDNADLKKLNQKEFANNKCDVITVECQQEQNMKYVSPLDTVKRETALDPFAITCPFEIDGKCRDPECGYKHYLRP